MADVGIDIDALVIAPAQHPRAALFSNFRNYVLGNMPAAQGAVDEAAAGVARVTAITPTTMEDLRLHGAMLAAAQKVYTSALGKLTWLRDAAAIPAHRPRTAMATAPTWSFAGDLLAVARDIEALVSETVPIGRGSKDDLPLVYVSNPPRHGKSLLLDRLFHNEAARGVCVLGATYNAATLIGREDLGASALGALRGLFLRLINDLVFGRPNWDEIWDHSPLASAENPLQVFREMLGLDSPSAPKLLINIDEVSKLVDDDACVWARDVTQQKTFWRGLYSLTRATQNWTRVVMTGFTDTPNDTVTASDVSCRPFALSMILGPEQELLAAELMWAYAVENTEPFPGLLWALTKSTPGLLGLWAQLIKLHLHVRGSCTRCATLPTPDTHDTGVMAIFRDSMRIHDFGRLEALVPWVSSLVRQAEKNWPTIVRFLVEEDDLSRDTVRAARNSDLATLLGQRVALSPFAVAITVLALRGRRVPLDAAGAPCGPGVMRFLDDALRACEEHSAGCAANMPQSWRFLVQKQLSSHPAIQRSDILNGDPRLAHGAAPLPEPSAVMPGASVQNLGAPYENFVQHAIALRLECLRLSAAVAGKFPASRLLPNAIGILRRSPLVAGSGLLTRHPADSSIAVALPTDDAGAFLARLCTQTAALLLPSSVNLILAQSSTQSVNLPRHFESTDVAPPPDLSTVEFLFNSVAVASAADCPVTFPVVVISPALQASGNVLGQLLRQSLVAALTDAARSHVEFDAARFSATVSATHGVDMGVFVPRVVAALQKVVQLIERAALMRQAIIFKPTDPINPLCDVCATIPCAAPERSVFVILFEVRDRRKAQFRDKLEMANVAELLLGPAAEMLAQRGVSIAGTIFVPVARAPFVVLTAV